MRYTILVSSRSEKKTILVSFVRVGAQFDGENVGIYDVFNQ